MTLRVAVSPAPVGFLWAAELSWHAVLVLGLVRILVGPDAPFWRALPLALGVPASQAERAFLRSAGLEALRVPPLASVSLVPVGQRPEPKIQEAEIVLTY